MKTTWIVVTLAGALLAGCKSERAPTTRPAAASRPLPGTEAAQKLFAGTAHAAPAATGAAAALGSLFGKGGALGGGGLGGLAGGPAATARTHAVTPLGAPIGPRGIDPADVDPPDTADDTADVDPPATADVDPPPTAPPVHVALPPPPGAGGDCGAVARRLGELTRAIADAQLADLDLDARKLAEEMVTDSLAAIPPMLERACTEQAWPQALRDCLLTGADLDALAACQQLATPAMTAQAQAPAIAVPSTPPPVWAGGTADCTAAADHASAIIEWQLSGAPPGRQQQGADLIAQVRPAVAAACEGTPWPEATIRCTLAADSVDALNACATP